jgi:hypothetical protein
MKQEKNDKVYEFDAAAIDQAIAQARQDADTTHLTSLAATNGFADSGRLSISPQCISVTTQNNKVCVSIPHFGTHCLPIPVHVPSGTVGQACITICTHFGIPTGAKVTVSIGGHVVVSKTFGVC